MAKKVAPRPPPIREDGEAYKTTYAFPLDRPDPTVYENIALAWRVPNTTIDDETLVQQDDILRNVRDESERRRESSYCPATSQIRIRANEERWTLETYDKKGIAKTVGGDEFYITYRDHEERMAVAIVTDQHNGCYVLDFVETPLREFTKGTPSERVLFIELQYTCGLGKVPFPEKLNWHTGGMIMIGYRSNGGPNAEASSPSSPSSVQPIIRSPPIHPFVEPNADKSVDLGQYDKVVIYGDSNLEYMYLCSKQRFPNLLFVNKPQRALNRRQAENKFVKEIRIALQEQIKAAPKARLALVVGSNTWDIVFGVRHGRDFKNHIEGCQFIVERLRDEFRGAVDIYWWSGTALHIHQAKYAETHWSELSVLKYISQSRAMYLYQRQLKLMERLGVPLLDVMEASYLSAIFQPMGDTRHYTCALYNTAIAYFYKER